MSTTSETLVDYYKALLIGQYRDKPKASGTIGALIGGTGDYGLIAAAIANLVRDGFDLDTAVGAQLDTLGKFRGVDRYYNSLNLNKDFLQLPGYSEPGVGTLFGIATYADTPMPPSTYTMTYEDFIESTLQDGDFRRVIKFLAAVHSCDFSYEKLDDICYTFFGGNVNLEVTGNMQITYQHLTTDTDNLFEILKQMSLLPGPAGVEIVTAEVGSF
jgi:hypothetical protein